MLDQLMGTIFGETITANALMISSVSALIMGAAIALCHKKSDPAGYSMAYALFFLPFLVHLVIFLVNGNIGAGVAVAGAFSLIRFRSAPGSAKDICVIFLAMTVGLACGMGYVGIGFAATMIVCILMLITSAFEVPGGKSRDLKITIPENLDYYGLFDDLMNTYTSRFNLVSVKTVNMGSLYSLNYNICLKDESQEKEFIDRLRCRNGNLEVSCGRVPEGAQKKSL